MGRPARESLCSVIATIYGTVAYMVGHYWYGTTVCTVVVLYGTVHCVHTTIGKILTLGMAVAKTMQEFSRVLVTERKFSRRPAI